MTMIEATKPTDIDSTISATLSKRFKMFAECPKEDRPALAAALLREIPYAPVEGVKDCLPMDGLIIYPRSVDSADSKIMPSIADHAAATKKVITDLWAFPRKMDKMAEIAPLHKAITGFIPEGSLPAATKSSLEDRASEVIFAAFPEEKELWKEFKDGKSERARDVKEAAVLGGLDCAIDIERKYPAAHYLMSNFWTKAERSLSSSVGVKEVFYKLSRKRIASVGRLTMRTVHGLGA